MYAPLETIDIHIAFKKLKSYVYHENFSLHLRVQIAKYETPDIDKKLTELGKLINSFSLDEKEGVRKYFSEIDVLLMPKAFTIYNDNLKPNDAFYFSNANKQEIYSVDSCTPFINCPVELHIICMLWIMKVGHHLDSELNSNCYSNRLVRNTDEIYEERSIKLFKKYYINYSLWRDDAIKKAQELHNLKLDVAILNLDLKDYYNSIDFDFKQLSKSAFSQNWAGFDWLNTILEEIHAKYILKLKSTGFSLQKNKRILPIGLISSSILSNYYLREFDKIMSEKLKPEFYGRYVDDILIVKSNPIIPASSENKADEFIQNYLADPKIWTTELSIKKKKGKKEYFINIQGNEISFQLKKVKLYHFHANESDDLLDEFKKNIQKNSSEFKFQPESQEVFDSFENASYKISYSDTINKIRSIDSFDVDKFGASKHLIKLINTTRNAEKLSKDSFEELNERINNYFSGKRSLELYSLWEKVFTFYIVNDAKKQLIEFAREQIRNIGALQFKPSDRNTKIITDGITKSLFVHLGNCFSMGAALNLIFFNDSIITDIKKTNYTNDVTQKLKLLTSEIVLKDAHALIQANLLRHNFVFYPLVNYCKLPDKFNFLDKSISTTSLKLDISKFKNSPRFIHYHELCLFFSHKKWLTEWQDAEYDEYELNQSKFIYDKYSTFNSLSDIVSANNLKYYPIEEPLRPQQKKIKIESKKKVENLVIGIVNALINFKDSFDGLLGSPKLSFNRLDEINMVLNSCLSKKNKCDFIIFPEISIPYQWLSILTAFAKRNQVGIICGIEHVVNSKKEALNFAATILPFMHGGYTNAMVDLRLKIDYSPEEKELIKGRFFKIPSSKIENEKMRLYVWNNIHFGVFNCFELSDIAKRSMFRGEVDFIATVEHNQDVNYFSNITESVARDIHSYIIQVNNSVYGDSRIARPSETYKKDILKIKGGKNILAIIDSLDIKRLREFQKLDYNLQKADKSFKPTPPNFEMSESRKKH